MVEPPADVGIAEKQQATPNRNLRVCEPMPRLSGDIAMPQVPPFTCGAAVTTSMPVLSPPLTPEVGRLCGSQTAWARVRIPVRARYRFLLQGPTTVLQGISPSGDRVFTLNEGQSCVELDMEAGIWVLAGRPRSAEANNHGFELWVEPAL